MKRPKPARGEAFGILNKWGDFWTWQTFSSEAWARHYIADFWRGNKNAPDLSEFKVIPVRVTVSAKPPPPSARPGEGGSGQTLEDRQILPEGQGSSRADNAASDAARPNCSAAQSLDGKGEL